MLNFRYFVIILGCNKSIYSNMTKYEIKKGELLTQLKPKLDKLPPLDRLIMEIMIDERAKENMKPICK